MSRLNTQLTPGSLCHRTLLAMRPLENHTGTLDDIGAWLPHVDNRLVCSSLMNLIKYGYVQRKGSGKGRGIAKYALTDAGAALVDPVTGPLSRRKIAEAEPSC